MIMDGKEETGNTIVLNDDGQEHVVKIFLPVIKEAATV